MVKNDHIYHRPNFDKKSRFLRSFFQPFELKIHQKVGLLRPKTIPKQLLNNSKTTLKKSRNRLFWLPKWSKMTISWAKFWPKFSIFKVICQPFELKIHPKVGLLSPKTMPKHFLNYTKTTLKKSKKRLFWPQNGQRWTSQMSKVGQILTIFGVTYQTL